jgi:hypothetical protein
MIKQTKRIRRNKKNKTRKYYGGRSVVPNNKLNTVTDRNESTDRSKGIFDVIGDNLSGYSGEAFDYVKDKGLRLIGLQSIKQPVEIDNSKQEVDQKNNETGDSASGMALGMASGIASDVKNVFDKGSAAVIENINDVLKNPEVGASLNEAATETAQVGVNLLENFNKSLSTPELKEETKKGFETAAEYANIVVESMDKPINNAVDELNEAGTKAASGVVTGAIKVGTNAMSAVPYFGGIISLGKIVNDVSKAAGDIAGAASDASSTISKVVEETSKNIDTGLDKLEEKKEELSSSKPDETFKPEANFNELKKVGGTVSNRVEKSINEFENPISSVSVLTGGRKTRRKLFKNKGKSKRVRFVI